MLSGIEFHKLGPKTSREAGPGSTYGRDDETTSMTHFIMMQTSIFTKVITAKIKYGLKYGLA